MAGRTVFNALEPQNRAELDRLSERGSTLKRLNELLSLADPQAAPLAYQPADMYAQFRGAEPPMLVDPSVPSEVDEFETMLQGMLGARQGNLLDDFDAMKVGANPWGQFSMEEDQGRIMSARDTAKDLGRTYDPAGGPEGAFVPQQYGVEVGMPIMHQSAPDNYGVAVGTPKIEDREKMWAKMMLENGFYGQ